MKQIKQLFKWSTLLFIAIAIYGLTFASVVPIEFADWHHMHLFYDIILQGLPLALLLTLVWTIKKERPLKTNVSIGALTLLLTVTVFFGMFFLMFSFGFGAWVNENIIYQNKENTKITINKQIWDVGAFGYGGQRTVKLTPFLGPWIYIEHIDTSKMDKTKWTLVQQQGEVKTP